MSATAKQESRPIATGRRDILCISYDEIISRADLYNGASIEAKKMIVNSMIKRIDVFRDYKLKIEFNFDIKQFFFGIDKEMTFDMTA